MKERATSGRIPLRMGWTERTKRSAAVFVALGLLAVQSAEVDAPARAQVLDEGPPNILVIVTDDQRADTLPYMPKTNAWLGDEGTTFTNAFTSEPLCCPARASIFTGRYPHNHQVKKNGQVGRMDQRTTIQRYLDDAGYRTGIVGKYFIQWPIEQAPPHFDEYAIGRIGVGMLKTNYYGAEWNVNGDVRRVNTYSTTFVKRQAKNFIRRSEAEADAEPWFLYAAVAAPHRPLLPQKKYASEPVPRWRPAPSVYEADRSDKPSWISDRSYKTSFGQRRAQLRMLMSVDEMVDSIMQLLERKGEADNTLVLFTSDHGFFWGEHGATGKGDPYEEGIAVPLIARWPGHIDAGRVDDRLVSLVDIAPTLAEAAGVAPDPAEPMDGTSLLGTTRREQVLVEYFGGRTTPSWAALRTDAVHFIEYYDEMGRVLFREYYDMVNDPYQMKNLLGDRSTANDPSPTDVALLSGLVAAARVCKGSTCP